MTIFLDVAANFHPYDCDGPGKCIHCDRLHVPHPKFPKPLYSHDPANCELCDPEYDHLPNTYWDQVRP